MRYHPLTIAFHVYQLVKNSIFIIFLLFVLRKDSEFWLFQYGRYLFLAIVVLRLIYVVVAWFVENYEWKDRAFHIHKGVFVRHTSTIPFSKIQNVTRKTTVFHKLFGVTSVTFETAMDGEDDGIHFLVVSKDHANFLVDLVQTGKSSKVDEGHVETEEAVVDMGKSPEPEIVQKSSRVVHFTPQRKDLWKASFTSLSFLAIIPIGFGLLEYIEPLLPDQDEVEGLLQFFLATKWLFAVVILLIVLVAVGFGIVRTFIRYGKYEISSDATHIYIERGVLDESQFTIEKRKIQGLEMSQSFMKRIFGLTEVKIISSANPNTKGQAVNVNSLYPFLPINQAYQLIKELLPIYQLDVELTRLPKKSLWVKLLKMSWVWIVASIGLAYFKPDIFGVEQAWWILIILLILLMNAHGILDYFHTKYAVTNDQVQWWRGGFTSRLFITKRVKVIEMTYSQSRLQSYFQVASITTMNRSIPAHVETINDIPFEDALAMKQWYVERREEVRLK